MDKLEQYLDQVCRRIAGPSSLRQHIRQELREHLMDAVAEHTAAGVPEDQAIERALEDFGGPEQVRMELEATHGHRLMAVVIDRAMQWKELTMKAKLMWTAWAHLMLVCVVAAEVVLLAGVVVFLVPKQMVFYQEGWMVSESRDVSGIIAWGMSFLRGLAWAINQWAWWVLPMGLLWGLFEWRSRCEYKVFIRLSAMGTAALGLIIVVGMTLTALTVPLMVALPEMAFRLPEPMVEQQVANVAESLQAMEQAVAKSDWDAVRQHASHASDGMGRLANMGASAPVLVAGREPSRVDEVRRQLKLAREYLKDARRAATNKDATGVTAALEKFHAAYGQVPATTKE